MEPGGDGGSRRTGAERLERAVTGSPDGVLIVDLAGRVQFANPSAVAMLGASHQGALVGTPWVTLWGEPDQAAARAAFETAAGGASVRFGAVVQTQTAEHRQLDLVLSTQVDPTGAPDGVFVVSRDVTETETARLAAEARERGAAREASALRTVAEMANLGSWSVDYRHEVVTMDSSRGRADGAHTELRLPIEEALGKFDPEDRERLDREIERARREHRPFKLEAPVTRSDGTRAWFRVFGEPVYQEGVCVGLRGAKIDITEERAARENIERAEQRLQLAIELAGMEVFELDFDQQKMVPAGSWASILRDPPRDADVWPDPFQAADPRDQAHVLAAWTEALHHETPFRCEFRIHGRDGQEAWVYCVAEAVREGGEPKRVVAALLDITERKRRELELVQAIMKMREHESQQKLLLDELNHRVKNTLASVQSVALQTLAGGRDLQEARDLFIERLLALSSTHDLLVKHAWTSASFREIVAATLKPYDHPWRYEGPDFQLDPNFAVTLGLLVHELATNAIKHGAWRSGGQIEIATAVEHGEALISWQESGGPPVAPPTRRGFGSRLLQRAVIGELGGRISMEFLPEGLMCRMQIALSPRLRLVGCEAGGPEDPRS